MNGHSLAVAQRLISLVLREHRLALVRVRHLVAAAAHDEVRVREPAEGAARAVRPPDRMQHCGHMCHGTALQQVLIVCIIQCRQRVRLKLWQMVAGPRAHRKEERTISWPAPAPWRGQSGTGQRCLQCKTQHHKEPKIAFDFALPSLLQPQCSWRDLVHSQCLVVTHHRHTPALVGRWAPAPAAQRPSLWPQAVTAASWARSPLSWRQPGEHPLGASPGC